MSKEQQVQQNSYKTIRVERSKHTSCGKMFFEIENEEIQTCPHCFAELDTDTVEKVDTEDFDIEVDSKTGRVIS